MTEITICKNYQGKLKNINYERTINAIYFKLGFSTSTTVNGIAFGSIIALAAVGLTLAYGILRLSNFAHGDFLTVGAYLTLLANSFDVNIWVSIIIAAVGTIGVTLLSEKLLWSRMRELCVTPTTFILFYTRYPVR